MEAIEEDDEFEEFEPCNWGSSSEDAEDAQQWKVRDDLNFTINLQMRVSTASLTLILLNYWSFHCGG